MPDRGLDRVAVELLRVVDRAAADVADIARPRWRLRIAIGSVVLVVLAGRRPRDSMAGVSVERIVGIGSGAAEVAAAEAPDALATQDMVLNIG
ncbi:MAG: hypothetical protein M3455_01595, partial [Actinomycetota bacterium]|nr:hypothetical protein [Actinomycetota bacterium]